MANYKLQTTNYCTLLIFYYGEQLAYLHFYCTHNPKETSSNTSFAMNAKTTDNKYQCCNSNDMPLFEEALMYLGAATLVYLYADMRNLSGTGRLYTSFEHLQAEKIPLTTTAILTTLLHNLRKEAADDKDGLVRHVKGDGELTEDAEIQRKRYMDKTIFVLFERHVKNSLKVPGPEHDPRLCILNGKPLPQKSLPESCKNHVGSHEHNICAKHGLHYLQLIVDATIQNGDGKANGGRKSRKSKSVGSPIDDYSSENIAAQDALLDQILCNDCNHDDSSSKPLITSQFKEGSLWYNLIESEMRIVWFNDRYPYSETVYGIAVQRNLKRICVFFRGTVNIDNWRHNLQRHRVAFPNPVKEEYSDRKDKVMIHEGFSKYLFFKRRDNNMSKYDEIVEKICDIGKETFGDGGDFTVVVTGHSLGGALATIFGFYASADQQLPHASSVRVFSYASPYVADQSFASAFRHQEESKKLLHARLYNKKDVVTHIPANMLPKQSGAPYEHTGIGIELKSGKGKVPRYTRVKEYSNRWDSIGRAYKNNLLVHLPWLGNIKFIHSLAEYQDRVFEANEQSKDDKIGSVCLDCVYKICPYS